MKFCERKPSPNTEDYPDSKRPTIDYSTMSITPDELKQDAEEISELDKSVVKAIELLLRPIQDDMRDLLATQVGFREELSSLKEEIMDNKWLHEEKTEHDRIEKENKSLSARRQTTSI